MTNTQKQTNNNNNNKSRKILLSTLIPVSAVALGEAAAIVVLATKSCQPSSPSTADITSLYDEYLKNIDVYTTDTAAVNYFFQSKLLSSTVDISVKLLNLKIDNVTVEKINQSIISVKKDNVYLRVDFDLVSFRELYGDDPCTVTFDLQFTDTNTSLDKTISGYTLNVKEGEVEKHAMPSQFLDVLTNDDYSFLCDYKTGTTFYVAPQTFRDAPKLWETYGINTIQITNDVDFRTTGDTFIWFPADSTCANHGYNTYDDIADLPACVKTLKIDSQKTTPTSYSIKINIGGSSDETKNYGFETIDLVPTKVTGNEWPIVFDVNSFHGTSFHHGALQNNTNLKTIIFSPSRTITFKTLILDTRGGCNPLQGCKKLCNLDLSNYKTTDDLAKIIFSEEEGSPIFNASLNTHAAEGKIIVAKGSTDAFKKAVSDKFADAGLTIDGTKWKIEEKA